MLRVGTGQKARRAVGGSFFKLWESKEKLTGRNTPLVVHKTKGLRNSREEPPHPRWRKEAGGGARGKLSPREATPSHPANRHGFLSEGFLRPDLLRKLGQQREKAHRSRGERARKPLAARAARRGCLARAGRVLPTHSDICLQRPALPTAGLN